MAFEAAKAACYVGPGVESVPRHVELAAIALAKRTKTKARQDPIEIAPVQYVEFSGSEVPRANFLHRALIFAAPSVGEGRTVERVTERFEQGFRLAGDRRSPIDEGAEDIEEQGFHRGRHGSTCRRDRTQLSARPRVGACTEQLDSRLKLTPTRSAGMSGDLCNASSPSEIAAGRLKGIGSGACRNRRGGRRGLVLLVISLARSRTRSSRRKRIGCALGKRALGGRRRGPQRLWLAEQGLDVFSIEYTPTASPRRESWRNNAACACAPKSPMSTPGAGRRPRSTRSSRSSSPSTPPTGLRFLPTSRRGQAGRALAHAELSPRTTQL